MKATTVLFFILLSGLYASAQAFKFAVLSDTHIGVKNADEDLRLSVADINADTSIKFVFITGDITELGTDEEMLMAKDILSKLKKLFYIQTGNHDVNWSPGGGKIFNSLFGPGRFAFRYNNYLFIGTNSGPFMRHRAPGQVPREDLLWMDSVLNHRKNKNIPVIYANHYPQDSSQRNWFEAIDRLKKKNVQLILVGHGHLNTQFVFEGIPGIMGRSNLRDVDSISGYTIVSISDGKARFEERRPQLNTIRQWSEIKLNQHNFANDTQNYSRPLYAVNTSFSNIKMHWRYEDKFDIIGGAVCSKNLIVAANTGGSVYALNAKDGKKVWAFKTKGKIFSTPVISNDYVIVASTDSNVYCLNVSNGKHCWNYKTAKPIIASPSVKNNVVYIGSFDGNFTALYLATGKIKWQFNGVKDFVSSRPLIYNDKVLFGSWGSEFYALNAETGNLEWKWTDTSNNRMVAPGGCYPVATAGKLYVVAPDQYTTCFDVSTGNVIWRTKMPNVRVRESIGLSSDSTLVYVKTTDGKLCSVPTAAIDMQTVSTVNLQLGYDICAAPIIEDSGIIYVPSNSGVVTAVDSQMQTILWKHKVSNCNISSIIALNDHEIIVTTDDGKITCLQF